MVETVALQPRAGRRGFRQGRPLLLRHGVEQAVVEEEDTVAVVSNANTGHVVVREIRGGAAEELRERQLIRMVKTHCRLLPPPHPTEKR